MPSISLSNITLRIMGPNLDPEKMTRQLGCPPTASARAGETFTSHTGVSGVLKEGFWILEYAQKEPAQIDGRILALLDQLTSDIVVWKKITRNFHAGLYCGLIMAEYNEGWELSPEVLRRLSERRLKVSFDLFAPPVNPTMFVAEKVSLVVNPAEIEQAAPLPASQAQVDPAAVFSAYGEALALAQSMETGMSIFYRLDKTLPAAPPGKAPRIDFDNESLSDLSQYSLGGFIRQFRRELLDEGDIDATTRNIMRNLERSVTDRNWLVHTYWWERQAQFRTSEGRAAMLNELQAMVAQFQQNDDLIRRMVLHYLELFNLKVEQFLSIRFQEYVRRGENGAN
jgi:hypothetical protein